MFNILSLKEFEGKDKFNLILFVCLLFVLPLIIANVPYMDDHTRLDNGYGYWEIEGRPLTTLLFKLLNFNLTTIYNIAPLPLLVGVFFFSYSVYYATNKMNLKNTILNIFPFILLVCNPFFLQNMSYQYDSIGHLFSVGFILLAFFYQNNNKYKQFLVSSLLIAASCASYQPTSNMYIALFCVSILFNISKKDNEGIMKYTIRHISYYLSGILIYYVLYFIGFSFLFTEQANRNHLISINQIMASYEFSMNELINLLSYFKDDISLYLIIIAAILLPINIIYRIYNITKSNMEHKEQLYSIVMLILLPLLLLFSIWGPFILLKELFFNPRDFPVMGVFCMLISFSFSLVDKKYFINVIFNIAIFLCVFSFSYMYGNALNQDYTYRKYVYDSISNNIEQNMDKIRDKKIYVYGRHAMTSYIGKAFEVRPFLSKLIFPDNTNFFKEYSIAARNVYNIQGGVIMDNLDEWNAICKNKIVPLVKNGNYEIFNFDDHISVWFKREPTFCNNYPTDVDSRFDIKQHALESK